MKRNEIKQKYHKETLNYYKDSNGLINKEYMNWLEDKLKEQFSLNVVSQELKDKYHEDFDVFIEVNKFKRINYNVFLAQNGEYWIREEVDILMENKEILF
jgi:hypothetical protein